MRDVIRNFNADGFGSQMTKPSASPVARSLTIFASTCPALSAGDSVVKRCISGSRTLGIRGRIIIGPLPQPDYPVVQSMTLHTRRTASQVTGSFIRHALRVTRARMGSAGMTRMAG